MRELVASFLLPHVQRGQLQRRLKARSSGLQSGSRLHSGLRSWLCTPAQLAAQLAEWRSRNSASRARPWRAWTRASPRCAGEFHHQSYIGWNNFINYSIV